MREPGFWYRPPSLLSSLLRPLGAIYGAVAAHRMAQPGTAVGVPVLCIGNFHGGGAGKTPTALALARLLLELGERPVVLSRGYGGRLHGPVSVDPGRHGAADVGDEPLMMARDIPVVVARDRVAGAALARSRGASVILMDDGFQNPAVAKDAALIVIDGDRGLGNGYVIPAGPLRAPLPPQLARTDALIVVGRGRAADPVAAAVKDNGGLLLRARFLPAEASLAALCDRPVLAFAGIGDPARFFATLRTAGINVAAERVFADHHPYAKQDLAGLTEIAGRDGFTLVTTEKDLARLRSDPAHAAFARSVVPFAVTLEFDDAKALRDFVIEKLTQARDKHRRAGRS
ncbi:tetraacyldisaccharide 4'-kinase [Rhodopseudomonas palustris]|uniref:Tetraacyldisaccharide 4'-kinase n=1 Tax=Rhodopseudomonas palustris (strain BisB18) TaxID=316056 RepID=LPXK_RHOPB|nr:RecName: Full=Tetraacyldisaccharide 4'-kinase; AltName: Full=Lipid A 4'-kinase [Rhodopseudomonas palustris BisB18]